MLPTKLSDFTISSPNAAANTAFDKKEHWAVLETLMQEALIEDKKAAKRTIPITVRKKRIFTSVDIVIEPVIVQDAVIAEAVEAIVTDETEHNDVSQLLLKLKEEAAQTNDQSVLNAVKLIDDRLTDSINDFVRNELAITTGTIDSFIEDINDLCPYINATYGESASDAFLKNKERIIKRALTTGTDEFLDIVKSMYFGFIKEDSDLKITPFTSGAVYALIDLSSIELQLDVFTSKCAVGLLEQDFPLLYSIAIMLMDSPTPDNVAINHYFLRTNDKVVYEFTRGAINPAFIFVSIVA